MLICGEAGWSEGAGSRGSDGPDWSGNEGRYVDGESGERSVAVQMLALLSLKSGDWACARGWGCWVFVSLFTTLIVASCTRP